MSRAEFGKPVKREALKRADGHCEAQGVVYGLQPGQRCNSHLSYGVEFDHWPVRAADGGPATLDNCAAVCLSCHRHKTRTFDTPMAAKGKRISDKRIGITKPKRSWPSRSFGHRAPDNTKHIDRED